MGKVHIDDWLARQLAVEKIQHSESRRMIRRLIRVVVILACLAIAGITGGLWAIGRPGTRLVPIPSASIPVSQHTMISLYCRPVFQPEAPRWAAAQGVKWEAEQVAGRWVERAG